MQGELTAASVSRYNAKKVRGFCEMCNVSLATETHHLLEQRHADKDGFIAGTAVHKNHVANLAALCEACHLKMHHKAEEDGKPTGNVHSATVRKKTTSGKYVLRGTH
jgi:5-methylcytosine-specific restriction endonuclease McrA